MTKSSRRGFMKTAGMTAILSATGSHRLLAQGSPTRHNPSKHDFDEHFNRIGHDSDKWDYIIQQYGRDKIKASMGVADMDFRQFSAVNEALAERAKYENYGYEMVRDTYYQSIIDWNKNRYGQTIKKEWIRNSPTLLPGITSALRGLNPHKGKVILQTPTYSGFWGAIRRAEMERVEIPLKQNNGKFSMDLAAVEAAFDDQTKCLILCNPNNPTGTCWSADEMRALGDLCMRYGVTVLSDEIHCDFVRKDKKFTPYASIGEKYANSSITFRSSSKTFGHASLCVAHFFSQNEDLINAAMRTHKTSCNTYGLLATEVAYSKGAEWTDQLNEYIDGNHQFLYDYINRDGEMPGLKYTVPDGTYLAWLDFGGLAEKIANPDQVDAFREKLRSEGNNRTVNQEVVIQQFLIHEAGVEANNGSINGKGANCHIRMNLALPRAELKAALDHINAALKAV